MLTQERKIFIEKTNDQITSKSGLVVIVKAARQFGVIDEIKKRFPKGSNAAYSPEIPIIGFVLMLCGGGYKIEDINVLRNDLALLKILDIKKFPSPDTLIGFMKEPKNIKLLSKVLDILRMNIIKQSNLTSFIFDVDATLIETEKECATYCYKEFMATSVLLGFLAEIDLCVTDNYRGGSVHAGVGIDKQLIKVLAMLKVCKKGLSFLRSDSAAHNHKIFNICERHKVKYLIALKTNAAIQEIISDLPADKWMPILKDGEYTEVDYCESIYCVAGAKKPTRLLIKRDNKKAGSLEIPYAEYYVIGTNDWQTDVVTLLEIYNKRGNAENYNKEMKSGLNLAYTPFNKLEENAAYFKLGVLAFNLLSALKHFLLKGDWIKNTVGTLRWKLFFIAGKVQYRKRQWFLKLAGLSDITFNDFKEVLCSI